MRFKSSLQIAARGYASGVHAGGGGRGSLTVIFAVNAMVFAALAIGGSSISAQRGGVWLVSRARTAEETGMSTDPTISDDALRIAFASDAADLVPSDTNGVEDVFLFERPGDSVRRLSLMPDGSQADEQSMMPSLSPDGRWVALRSVADLVGDGSAAGLFLFDIDAGVRIRISTDTVDGRGASFAPTVSADGQRVLFLSTLGADGEGAGSWVRAFLWDRESLTSVVVSPEDPSADVIDIAISDDGGTVAFATESDNIIAGEAPSAIQVYARAADVDSSGGAAVFTLGTAERISTGIDGVLGSADSLEPSLSADGRLVAFTSYAANLVIKDDNGVSDIFIRDRDAGLTTAVTTVDRPDSEHHPADSAEPDLSPDGTRIAFASGMRDIVPGDRNLNWDIFVKELVADSTRRVNLTWDGREADRDSRVPAISADGVGFLSHASLAPEDGDDEQDVYLVALHASPEHPTLEPHPSATLPPHATATLAPPHATATLAPPHATATTVPPHATATIGHHPTATHDPHQTATPDPHSSPTHAPHPTATGHSGLHSVRTLWFPACGTTLSDAH